MDDIEVEDCMLFGESVDAFHCTRGSYLQFQIGKVGDDVVMTASKRNGHATIRLDRQRKSRIDFSKVHHEGGGPYTGILINKIADNLTDVDVSDGRIAFLAYLQDQEGETGQDLWNIRFWFRGKGDGMKKKKTFKSFYQELMNPVNFPNDYLQFVKRALVLFRKYDSMRRIELEVEQTDTPSDEMLSQIKSFISVFTPASYSYQFVPEISVSNRTFVTFMIKAAGDAHVALSAVYGDVERKTYEIVIGADGNTMSFIRDGATGPIKAEASTYNILREREFRYFWVSWGNNKVEVGRGAQYGQSKFLSWDIPENRHFNVNCLAVATGRASKGQWEFAELLDDTELIKHQKRHHLKVSLLWIAKKQKMLSCLEEAYPNTILLEDLWKMLKIKQSDLITAVVMLRDLEKRGLIREVAKGIWMRVQNEHPKEHEVKLVEELPVLLRKEHPTIAIITALYCEKIAVDAMIEQKTTFVKFRTEGARRKSLIGESQVYTLGKIGKHRVVSTKLSRIGTPQEAMIAAENTVTRLLGTFSQIDHVFLVGVGGAVPHYTDYKQHVRLGDVVVSKPRTKNGALYIYCQKTEKIPGSEGYSFMTRAWSARGQSLQLAIDTLKYKDDIGSTSKPWEEYIEGGKEILHGEESTFHKPPIQSDKLFFTKPDGDVIRLDHPRPTSSMGQEEREGQVNIRYGVIGSGKLVSRTDEIRREFAALNGILAFDLDFDCVLDSLEGNRCDSFLVIRGAADYRDGTKKEWQPYASLAAAAYMKAVIMIL